MKILVLLVLLNLCVAPVIAQDKGSYHEEAVSSKSSPPLLTEQEKDKISRDAKKLTEDFGAIINDLSSLGQKIGHSFVDTLSVWVSEHYKELSENQREKLGKFTGRMKEQLKDLEKMSVKKLANILKEFKDFLNQLEVGNSDDSPKKKDVGGKLI